jgi:putative transposase
MNDLKQRGVEDVLFACVDGLSGTPPEGFPEAIESAFPKTQVQLCVVHQIRYSMRLIPDKHYREFLNGLKTIYQAPDLSTAEDNLLIFEEKWVKIYPQAVQTWTNNWANMSAYFDYSPLIRKMIYTTNTIESYHRHIRKRREPQLKTKAAFTRSGGPFRQCLVKTGFFSHSKHGKKSGTKPPFNGNLFYQNY